MNTSTEYVYDLEIIKGNFHTATQAVKGVPGLIETSTRRVRTIYVELQRDGTYDLTIVQDRGH